jgi:hypothetical protein
VKNTSQTTPCTQRLNIVYQNVRGLKTKLQEWNHSLLSQEADIVAVTETFLDDSIGDPEVASSEWSVVRRDRPNRRGGGVLLAARPGITLRRHPELETTSGEDLWCSFSLKHVKYYVAVIYIPPHSRDNTYMDLFQTIESKMDSLSGAFVLLGDFNLSSASLNINTYYCYFLNYCDISDRNNVENSYGGKLDVVLVQQDCLANVLEIAGDGLVPHADAYHPPLDILVKYHKISQSRPYLNPSNLDSSRDWNFAKADYDLLYEKLRYCDWSLVYQATEVDSAVAAFYKSLYSVFDVCIPKKTRSHKKLRCYPVWYTPKIIKLISKKATQHRLWKSTEDIKFYYLFSQLRTHIKILITEAYIDHTKFVEQNIKANPRGFWNHVNSLRCKGGFEATVSYGGEEHKGANAALAFADFFSSVFLPDIPLLDSDLAMKKDNSQSATRIDVREISLEDVTAAINKLKPRSAVGPDNLPPYIIKAGKEFLVYPIHHILTLILLTSKYPTQWKMSRVKPIPKSKDSSKAENYRPVAILSCLSKIIEFILHHKISLQISPHLTDCQHGFRARRSVNSNLLSLTDSISRYLDQGSQVDVVYFDFQKAFDRVDNDILLEKLTTIGFTPKLLRLIADYLRDRQQFVRHGCYISPPYHTRSGLSQGSILGPLFFVLMINDLETVVHHSNCLLYADDLKLVRRINNYADCSLLQEDINAVLNWSKNNKLLFNLSKCNSMTFSRARSPLHYTYALDNTPIARVNSIKDLGVIFDDKLTFNEHIQSLAKESYKRLGFIIRNAKDFRDPKVVQLLYTTLVRSKIESSSIIWNPHEKSYILLLEKVQKAFLRFLYKKKYGFYPFLYPTKYLLGMLGFNSLEVRRNIELLTTACRILKGESDCSDLITRICSLFVPDKYLRGRSHRLLAGEAARTAAHEHSPVVHAQALLNKVILYAPDCDLFAYKWSKLLPIFKIYCEINF